MERQRRLNSMPVISELLFPDDVNLALAATTKQAAIEEVLAKLIGDPRISDWEALRTAVVTRDAPSIAVNGMGICIAHGRLNSVKSLVLAAGRSSKPLACSEIAEPLRLVFVAGIPAAFDSEYLRVVGAIVRICRDKHQLERLLAAREADYFVELLDAGEAKL